MAAGEGRRLRPLTEHYAKPVLPIDGRAVIATLMHELATAGVERVTVVTGHLAEQVESLLGDGAGFVTRIEFVRQPQPDGSADAVARALAAGATPPLLVTAADTVFSRGDVARFAAAFAESGAAGAISGRRDPPPSPPHRYGLRIEDEYVTRVLDHDPANTLAGAPLWAFGPTVAPFVAAATRPPFRPPYELSAAAQLAIDAGEKILGVEIGTTRDLTHPLDLLRGNFPYLSAL